MTMRLSAMTLTALAWSLGAGTAQADIETFGLFVEASVSGDPNGFDYESACAPAGPLSAAAAILTAESTGTADGTVNYGSLGGSTFVTSTIGGHLGCQASAVFQDVWTITSSAGGGLGEMQLVFDVAGTMEQLAPGEGGAYVAARLRVYAADPNGDPNLPVIDEEHEWALFDLNGDVSLSVDETVVTAPLGFEFGSSFTVWVNFSVEQSQHGSADFPSGVTLADVIVRREGVEVPFELSALSGTDYTGGGCLGDVDGDNAVTLADLGVVLANYGTGSGATLEDGDLDGDGDVDLADLGLILSRFGAVCA